MLGNPLCGHGRARGVFHSAALAALTTLSSFSAQAGKPGAYIGIEAGGNRLLDSSNVSKNVTVTPGQDPGGALVIPGVLILLPTGSTPPNITEETVRFKTTYEDGFSGGLTFGYAYPNGFRPEFNINYRRNDFESVTFQEGFGTADGSSTESVDGHAESLKLMGNVWYDMQTNSRVTPYIGFGVGASHFGFQNFAVAGAESIDDEDTVFSYQVGTGIAVDITDYLAISLDYRMVGSDDPKLIANSGDSVEVDERNHSALLSLRWNFKEADPLDADNDGVADRYDRCPGTPAGAPVNTRGCPLDSDGDGVPDYLDQCPNTPEGVSVNAEGCPLDSDGDGVPDYLDQCPGTASGVGVDPKGCPLDGDGDGVPDGLDQCPNTPAGVPVNAQGCALDSDGDGVPDDRDACPHTPRGAQVDATGCPIDSDGDGIYDGLDQCPGTAPGVPVNEVGCAIDSDDDGDTVPNRLDQCPDTEAGARVMTNGCAVGQSSILHGVSFDFASARLGYNARELLKLTVDVLRNSPGFRVEVQGHTDDVGPDQYNLKLSELRARSVREYLESEGINPARLVSKGYGEARPRVPNINESNREINRRVELKVLSAQ